MSRKRKWDQTGHLKNVSYQLVSPNLTIILILSPTIINEVLCYFKTKQNYVPTNIREVWRTCIMRNNNWKLGCMQIYLVAHTIYKILFQTPSSSSLITESQLGQWKRWTTIYSIKMLSLANTFTFILDHVSQI